MISSFLSIEGLLPFHLGIPDIELEIRLGLIETVSMSPCGIPDLPASGLKDVSSRVSGISCYSLVSNYLYDPIQYLFQ